MNHNGFEARDFLEVIEEELSRSRRLASKLYDRCQALVEVRSEALEARERLRRPLRPEDVFAGASEERLAQMEALRTRLLSLTLTQQDDSHFFLREEAQA